MDTNEILLQLLEGQKQTNERLDKMDGRLDKMEERLDKMDERMDRMEDRLDRLEEDARITRHAVNHIGDKFEELVTILNDTNVISFKYT